MILQGLKAVGLQNMTRPLPLLQPSFKTEILEILDLWPFNLTFTSYSVVNYQNRSLLRLKNLGKVPCQENDKLARNRHEFLQAFRLSSFSFPWSLACSSPVSRASSSPASPASESKRLRRRQIVPFVEIFIERTKLYRWQVEEKSTGSR